MREAQRGAELTDELMLQWEAWLAERPPQVAAVAREYPLYKVYRDANGYDVWITAYDEHLDSDVVTVQILVCQALNPHKLVLMDRRVFGVDPKTLTVAGD